MDPNHRLHLATRIHFGLLAQLGVAVTVEDLLDASPEGREALWVCEAMDDPELRALALEFTGRPLEPAVAPRLGAEVPALRHAVAPRPPLRTPPARVRSLPGWAPTALHGEDGAAGATAAAPAPTGPRAPQPAAAPTVAAVASTQRPAPAPAPAPAKAPAAAAPLRPARPTAPSTPSSDTAAAGHVAQPTAWSRDTSGFGFSRPQDLAEYTPPPFVPTPDALRPSASPPDISWATALRNRPAPAERPAWKLAFWRKD
jgi:hypothetical protein